MSIRRNNGFIHLLSPLLPFWLLTPPWASGYTHRTFTGSVMFKKGILLEVVVFVGILLFLFLVIPVISSLLRNLIALQLIIAVVGGLTLGVIVRRIRNRADR